MNTLLSFLPIILILGVFYLLTYRSMRRQREQTKKIETSLTKGTKVTTIGGLHAEVDSVTDTTVTLKAGTSKLVFDRKAIAKIDEAAKPEEIAESNDSKNK